MSAMSDCMRLACWDVTDLRTVRRAGARRAGRPRHRCAIAAHPRPHRTCWRSTTC